ncbi:hypothetical protein TNMX_00425 [Thermus sp. NMX2.A1]|nr:hypothetical protein TNMX_00425 [Thermus sp. NMX2.A1]
MDPRGSPHKPRKERPGEGGLPGVDLGVERYAAKAWGASRGPVWGLTLPRTTP